MCDVYPYLQVQHDTPQMLRDLFEILRGKQRRMPSQKRSLLKLECMWLIPEQIQPPLLPSESPFLLNFSFLLTQYSDSFLGMRVKYGAGVALRVKANK